MRTTAHRTRPRRSAVPRWLRAAVAILIVLGAIAGLQRAAQTLRPSRRAPGETLNEFEHRSLELLAGLGGVAPGTPAYQRMGTDVADFGRTYETHPRNTLLHVLPGALLMLLAPLQFSKRIRNRYLTFHRWLGRSLLVAEYWIRRTRSPAHSRVPLNRARVEVPASTPTAALPR